MNDIKFISSSSPIRLWSTIIRNIFSSTFKILLKHSLWHFHQFSLSLNVPLSQIINILNNLIGLSCINLLLIPDFLQLSFLSHFTNFLFSFFSMLFSQSSQFILFCFSSSIFFLSSFRDKCLFVISVSIFCTVPRFMGNNTSL